MAQALAAGSSIGYRTAGKAVLISIMLTGGMLTLVLTTVAALAYKRVIFDVDPTTLPA